MAPGPEYHGASRVPDGIIKLLGKKYSVQILEATLHGPRTVQEITRDFDLPRTTVYRRLKSLAEHDLVRVDLRVDPEGGSHHRAYESNLRDFHLRENDEGYELDVELYEADEEVWARAWKTMRDRG